MFVSCNSPKENLGRYVGKNLLPTALFLVPRDKINIEGFGGTIWNFEELGLGGLQNGAALGHVH